MTSQLEEMQRERTSLKSQVDSVTSERNDVTAQRQKVQLECDSLQANVSAMASRLKEEEAAREALASETNQLRAEMTSLATRARQLDGERMRLQSQCDELIVERRRRVAAEASAVHMPAAEARERQQLTAEAERCKEELRASEQRYNQLLEQFERSQEVAAKMQSAVPTLPLT